MKSHLLIALLSLGTFLLTAQCTYAQGKKAKVGKDFSLTIERTPCRGNCPGYTAKINASGAVDYEGMRAVANIGRFKKTLTSSQMKQIVAEFNNAGFFSMKDVYDDEGIADLPVTTITYTNRGKTKSVRARYMQPEKFDQMLEKIERIIGESGYTPVQ